MNVLFINGSANPKGNTASLAAVLLAGHDYDTVELGTTRVYGYGQQFEDDQFGEVLEKMKAADVIVMGSPVYWHNMSGMMRNLLDHFYGPVSAGELSGKKMFFVFQGAAPEKWMLEAGEYTMKRFASLYGMEYMGMASNRREAEALAAQLR